MHACWLDSFLVVQSTPPRMQFSLPNQFTSWRVRYCPLQFRVEEDHKGVGPISDEYSLKCVSQVCAGVVVVPHVQPGGYDQQSGHVVTE